ncbi:MAG: hypothetical protein DRI87_05610 [Bacteroidetes bacterium]|nr:MAG: hypothetical protein DRI87_05610 [Bacteroidota bacterium]
MRIIMYYGRLGVDVDRKFFFRLYTFYSNKCVQSLDIWVKICYNIGMNKMRNKYKKETASVAAAGNIRVLGNDYPGVTINCELCCRIPLLRYGSMAASQVV